MAHMKQWQAFDTSTEAGRMLKKLYGGAAGHPNIEYPKLRLKEASGAKKDFIPGGAGLHASDPRAKTRSAADVKVPRRVQSGPSYSAIDFVPRLKSRSAIEETMAEQRVRTEGFRPAASKSYSTDAEKARLQEKCHYGGGKALPDELTHPKLRCPSELKAEKAEKARVAKAWRRRRGEPEEDEGPPRRPVALDLATQRIQQITLEIEERQAFLESMASLGHGPLEFLEIITTRTTVPFSQAVISFLSGAASRRFFENETSRRVVESRGTYVDDGLATSTRVGTQF